MAKSPKRGAPKKDGTRLLRVRVSKNVHAYLSLLKRETMLGTSENDVAMKLLTEKLLALQADSFHEKGRLPERAVDGAEERNRKEPK